MKNRYYHIFIKNQDERDIAFGSSYDGMCK